MKTVIMVLGMHRSGTSVATRILHTLGASAPAHMLHRKGSLDNPDGYFEPLPIVHLNDVLLQHAGRTWKNYYPIPDRWFTHLGQDHFLTKAKHLLEQEFAGAETAVLKCPRLSLLLPFWEPLLRNLGISLVPVLLLRDPWAVAQSLERRVRLGMRKAAVHKPAHAALLWLRYTLEAERYTRSMSRVIVPYETLETDWRAAFRPFLDGRISGLPPAGPDREAQIDGFIRPAQDRRLQRNEDPVQGGPVPGLFHPFRELHQALQVGDEPAFRAADHWTAAMTDVHAWRSRLHAGPAYDESLSSLVCKAVFRRYRRLSRNASKPVRPSDLG